MLASRHNLAGHLWNAGDISCLVLIAVYIRGDLQLRHLHLIIAGLSPFNKGVCFVDDQIIEIAVYLFVVLGRRLQLLLKGRHVILPWS